MTIQTLTYQLSFNTPAFLGNAEQQAQWRTPPLKALLRQWWRIVKAPEVGFDTKELLVQENKLFGSALDDAGSNRSQIRLRLSQWDAGGLTTLPRMASHEHPEVKSNGRSMLVTTAIYLGFGPVTRDGIRSAIGAGLPCGTFKLRVPQADESAIRKAMQLAAWFGTVGSRSRNGWGSLHIQGEGLLGFDALSETALGSCAAAQVLPVALQHDWPHAFGLCADAKPAIWRVVKNRDNQAGKYIGFATWGEVMDRLAELKIGFRTQFAFKSGGPHSQVESRHVLAYPVTRHDLRDLKNARLANQVRFKVSRSQDGKYFGLISHWPCAMPKEFFNVGAIKQPAISEQAVVWNEVHAFLNKQPATSLARIRKG